MMKYELKIEFREIDIFVSFLKKTYQNGVLFDRTQQLEFDKDSNIYSICKGLANLCVRLSNDELIDGSLRFIITESEDKIFLTPCSLYYEYENNKYSFSV